MIIPAIALYLALSPAGAPPKTDPPASSTTRVYSDPDLGLAFDYPSNWTYQKKDKKSPARFTIPIEGTNTKGELRVIDLDYRGTAELFQTTQATMIATLNQTLVRQWQIEVLGVPMLLTKVKSANAEGETTTLVGLLYANTPRKFNFRLTAPSGQFEAVELPWQAVLETLRTTSGALPASGDTPPPKVDPKDKTNPAPPVTPKKDVTTEIGIGRKAAPYKGDVPLELPTGSQPAILYLPRGWRANPSDIEGTITLTHDRLQGRVLLRSYLAQADAPGAVLNRLAAGRLGEFGKVERRYDDLVEMTPGEGSLASVRRIGTDSKGKARLAYDGVFVQDVWFVSLSYESTNASRFKEESALVADLLRLLRIEARR